ncbi:hypothetical protein H9P43_000584 [Blastocladiella emersonii ATCC 22665]|nr:hypothetical protein H9P43_000584 [Blastocladiella emersonii ATCC 22665]
MYSMNASRHAVRAGHRAMSSAIPTATTAIPSKPALGEISLMPTKPLAPLPIKLKAKSLTKLQPAVATLADGTTVHLNAAAYAPQFTRETLPPPSHKFAATSLAAPGADPIEPRVRKDLSLAEISEIRALRTSDPDTWTVRKLAAKFGVSGVFISMVARCPPARLASLAAVEEERVARLPPSTLHHIRERQRRREQW